MSIGFTRTAINPLEGPEPAFLKQLKWGDHAPTRISKAARKGDVTRFVLAYRSWLEPFASRFRKCGLPAFGLLCYPHTEPTGLASLIADFTTADSDGTRYGLGRAVVGWVRSVVQGLTSPSERLLALELILDPPMDMETETWCRLWRLSLCFEKWKPSADTASGISREVEASIAASLLFDPLLHSERHYERAVGHLKTRLLDVTDTDGTPQAADVLDLGHWFTPWVRTGWWGRSFKQPVYTDDAFERFRDLVARATEYARGDGAFVFDREPELARTLLPVAAKVARWSKQTSIGRAARWMGVKRGKGKSQKRPSGQSDWSEVAHLRSKRATDADLFAITHDQSTPLLSLCCVGTPVLSGYWSSQLRLSGKSFELKGDWTCSCWHSDADGDFLELEQSGSSGVHLTRQVFLSRQEHFLMLLDSVRTTKAATVSIHTRLPLAQSVMSRADFVSREWRLHSGTTPIRVFPVSLAYDRVQSCAGSLTVEDGVLSLAMEGQQGVSASIVMDWHPDRSDAAAEWTPLTVTENRQVVPQSDAGAFRLRVGDHQVMAYRNLDGSSELRAVLGQHTGRETVIGTLSESGKFKPLVLVDASDE